MIYVFPLLYLVDSRLKSWAERISFFIIFPIPVLFLVLQTAEVAAHVILPSFSLALLAFYSVYEIGYLENDVKTTKRETNPNLRIANEELVRIDRAFSMIILSKVAVAFMLTLPLLIKFECLHLGPFIFALMLASVAFHLHNIIRNKWNILTYFGLSTTKYLALPALFIDLAEHPSVVIFTIFVFPVIRTLEHASKERYGLGFLKTVNRNPELIRSSYYAILSILTAAFCFSARSHIEFMILSLYFLAYRLTVFTALRNNVALFKKFRASRKY